MLAETVEMKRPSSKRNAERKPDLIEKSLALETIQLDTGNAPSFEPPGASTSDYLEAIPVSELGWPALLLIDNDPAQAEEVKKYCDERELRFHWLTCATDLETFRPDVPPRLVLFRPDLDGADLRFKIKSMRDRGMLGNATVMVLSNSNLDEPDLRRNRKLGFPIALKKPFALAALDRHITRPRKAAEVLEASEALPDTEWYSAAKVKALRKKLRAPQSTDAPTVSRQRTRVPPGVRSRLAPKAPAAPLAAEPKVTRARKVRSDGPWDKAILHAAILGSCWVALLACFPDGYTRGWAFFEGPLLGLAMGIAVARQLRQLTPHPTAFTLSITLLGLTLIPNALVLLERWVFGYDLVARHVPRGLPVQKEIPAQFMMKLEEPPPALNLDDYNGLISIGAGFVMAWSMATLTSLLILRNEPQRTRSSWKSMEQYE